MKSAVTGDIDVVGSVMRNAAIPDECSREIPVAPARGKITAFQEQTYRSVGDDLRLVDTPYKAGKPGIVRDIFDTMTDKTMGRSSKPPFSVGQVTAGRAYRNLNERVAASGIKCSSAFSQKTGSGSGTDFMDAYMADVQRLGWFHQVIGDGIAKDKRQKVQTRQGSVIVGTVDLIKIGRKLILVRALVDAVCIKEQSVSDVLKRHGWRPTGRNTATLRASLCAALDRMHGI
ncbi:MAG: hypothetical protein ABJL99_10080 [Aliishimia sp.]